MEFNKRARQWETWDVRRVERERQVDEMDRLVNQMVDLVGSVLSKKATRMGGLGSLTYY